MTTTAKTSHPRLTPTGSPHFRGVWNGRHERMKPADRADQRTRAGAIVTIVRRGTAAPVLPGRADIGVLGARRRAGHPGAA